MKEKKNFSRLACGVIALISAAVLLGIDQLTKYFVLQNLKPVGSVTVIGGLLEFTYVENTGAAFGLFKNSMLFVLVLTLVAFIAIAVVLFKYKNHTALSYIASTLLLAGGIGNLIDRLLYRFVVDFIHVMFFDYVFNFADCCVTVGAVLFVLHVLLISYREKKAEETEKSAETQE